MTSRLLMPFAKSMRMSLTNAGTIAYQVELDFASASATSTDRELPPPRPVGRR